MTAATVTDFMIGPYEFRTVLVENGTKICLQCWLGGEDRGTWDCYWPLDARLSEIKTKAAIWAIQEANKTLETASRILSQAVAAGPNDPWICDERIGCVAVYAGPQRSCLESPVESFIYYQQGELVAGHWMLDPKYRAEARRIAAAHNGTLVAP